MFIDKAKIYIKAGNGGNGMVAFLRLKAMAMGGPDGGDGASGGNIIFKADENKNNLSDFYYKVHYRAENGGNGETKNCNGKSGKDIVIIVPTGTVIRDFDTGKIIADMFFHGEEKVVLRGGKGGKGNSNFCTSTRQAPSFAQTGERTEEKAVILELKTIADVGLIGFPNVGKSTLLSVISAARPKIADYHFTTLTPNLGVVRIYEDSFVAADIPGLIEGAGTGAGLGHDFLRHVERTRMLVHVLDMSGSEGRNPLEDYRTINNELKIYNKKLSMLPQIIAANKMDVTNAEENLKDFKKHVRKYKIMPISAATGQGVKELVAEVYKLLKTIPAVKPLEFDAFEYERLDKRTFEITRTDDGGFLVTGGLVQKLCENVRLDNIDSFRYFQKQLRMHKVIDKLKNMGIKDGDKVMFGEIDFDFVE